MSSGEMKAVIIPRPNTSLSPASSSERSGSEEIPVTVEKIPSSPPKTAQEEQKKMSFAPSFDRLVEVNLHLTTAVDRLVKVSYLSHVVQLLILVFVAFMLLNRR